MKVKANFINQDVEQRDPDRLIDSFEYETAESIGSVRERLKMLKSELYFQDKLLESRATQLQQQIDALNHSVSVGEIDKDEAEQHIAALRIELSRVKSHDQLTLSPSHSEIPARRVLFLSLKDLTADVVIWWRYYDIPINENLSDAAIARAMEDYYNEVTESKSAHSQRLDRAEHLWAKGERHIPTICESIHPGFTFLTAAERESFVRKVEQSLAARRRRKRQGAKKFSVASTKPISSASRGDKRPVVTRNGKKELAARQSKSKVVGVAERTKRKKSPRKTGNTVKRRKTPPRRHQRASPTPK